MQKITEDLIEKFLKGECTREEAVLVARYLKANPEEKHLQDEYLDTDGETALPEGMSEEMRAFISEKTIGGAAEPVEGVEEGAKDGRGGRVRVLWKWAAAAAVVLVLFKVWPYLQPGQRAVAEQPGTSKAPEEAWVEKNNSGKSVLLLTLPDSTKVQLSPGGRMRYRKGFGSVAQRDVLISGKALFDVAKSERLPFTVFSDGLETRVLGTVFEVNANPYSDKIKVRLLTGKIVVSLEAVMSVKENKDYLLSPGQELVFTKSSRTIAINSPKRNADSAVMAKAHPVHADTISNWYMFNNQSLSDVFDQLSAIYNVDIEYKQDDIRNLYFIGKLEKKDSLNEIIRDIAVLNHLYVTSRNGKFIVTKR